MKKITFTGPRPNKLCGYDGNKYSAFINKLKTYLSNTYCNENICFITGGAQGFDQLTFWTIDLIKKEKSTIAIRNILYLPYKNQSDVWKYEGLFGQKQYKNMLKKADEITYLNDELSDKTEIIKALYDRNHAMVNDADILIALYPDDNWQNTKHSGTAECMRYAYENNKEIHQIKYVIDDSGNIIPTDLKKIRKDKNK